MKISFALFFLAVGIAAANGHSTANTTKCHKCLEGSFDDCGNEIENCTNPATDSCFSAAGRYKLKNGSEVIFPSVARGCVQCGHSNKSTGCANFKVQFDARPENWTLLACDIVCCYGDECNNQTVSYPDPPATTPTGSTATGTKADTEKPTDHATRHFPKAVILAMAAIVAALFFN